MFVCCCPFSNCVCEERADGEFVCGILKCLGLRDCSHWPQELRD